MSRAEQDAPGEEDALLEGPSLPGWARLLLRVPAVLLLFAAGLVGLTPSYPPIPPRDVLIFAVLPVALLLQAALAEGAKERRAALVEVLVVAGFLTLYIWFYTLTTSPTFN